MGQYTNASPRSVANGPAFGVQKALGSSSRNGGQKGLALPGAAPAGGAPAGGAPGGGAMRGAMPGAIWPPAPGGTAPGCSCPCGAMPCPPIPGAPMPGAPMPRQPLSAPASPADRLSALREKLTSATAAEVEQELRQLIVAGARGADAFSLLGMCHLLQNRPAEAERAFREALKLDGGHYRSLVNLGGLLLKAGRLEEAVPLLESSMRHTREGSPESLAALTNLAVAQTQLGRPIDAAQLVLRIFRIKPDHLQPDKLVVAASSLEEMGDDPGAIEVLQYLRSRLRDPGLNRRLAELLERRGDYQQAALVYRELTGSGAS